MSGHPIRPISTTAMMSPKMMKQRPEEKGKHVAQEKRQALDEAEKNHDESQEGEEEQRYQWRTEQGLAGERAKRKASIMPTFSFGRAAWTTAMRRDRAAEECPHGQRPQNDQEEIETNAECCARIEEVEDR